MPLERSRLLPTVNPLAERSLFSREQLRRWQGFPLGWVRATPELVGRCEDDGQLILAMIDAGRAEAQFRFGCRVHRHDLNAGDIGLFAPRAHADLSHWRCDGVTRIMVCIDPRSLGEEILAGGVLNPPPATALAFRDPGLAAVMRAMTAEISAGCPNGQLFAESLSLGVVMGLHRRSRGGAKRERGRLSRAQCDRLRELVRAQAPQRVTVAGMAQAIGLSPAQFVRQFKPSLGCSPYQFVLQTRLQFAHELLLHSRRTLAEVAQATGFSSQSHLTTLYARRYGVTPGEMRRTTLAV